MQNYIISCCSTADLTQQHFKERNIHYICFHFMLDDTSYSDDLGESIPFDEFYKKMADGALTKTSQVNADEFITYFRPFLEKGQDILHITLSSGLSGVYNSACIARDMLLEEFPDRKIYIVDSLGASSGYGLLMDALADCRDNGMELEELVKWVEDNRLNLHHWFFSTDLTFYIRGGRISKTAGAVGSLLNICPLLNMNTEGKLILREKIRTKRKVIKEIVEKMKACATGGANYNGKCFLSHSACYEDVAAVASLIETTFPHLNGKVEIFDIGTVIGSHTGPGTVALFFWGNERVI